MIYSEKLTIIGTELAVEDSSSSWFGVEDECLKQAQINNDLRAHEIAEARLNAEPGNERDDYRFIFAMKQKEDNKQYVDDVRHHKASGIKTFGIVEDIAEQWLSHNEGYMPVYPSISNPDYMDILELNQVQIKQIDGVTYKKGSPRYQSEVKDKHIMSELLVKLARGKGDNWIRVFKKSIDKGEVKAFNVTTNQGMRLVVPIYYNKKSNSYGYDRFREDHEDGIRRWVRACFPNIKVIKVEEGRLDGNDFRYVNNPYYTLEEDKVDMKKDV